MSDQAHGRSGGGSSLRVLAWETTRQCNLDCMHCRASASRGKPSNELSTDEGRRLILDVAARAKPLLILSGGEPLMRPDIFDLARVATDAGLKTVLATSRAPVDPDLAGDGQEGHRYLALTIKQLLADGGFKGRKVVSALPADRLRITSLRLADADAPRVEKALRQEASERFGLDPRRDVINYMLAGNVRHDGFLIGHGLVQPLQLDIFRERNFHRIFKRQILVAVERGNHALGRFLLAACGLCGGSLRR